MWGKETLITHHLCEMKGPKSSQPPCWTQLSCYKKCLTEVAGTWPSLAFFSLSLFLSSSLFSHSLSLCHCFATGWPLTPRRLVGVVSELTIPACCATPAFICLFPLTSNKYSSWVLVVALILTLCSPTFSTLLLQGSHGSGKFIGELMSIVSPRN